MLPRQRAHYGDSRFIYALSDRVYLSGCLTAFNFFIIIYAFYPTMKIRYIFIHIYIYIYIYIVEKYIQLYIVYDIQEPLGILLK